jgi:trigger factor
MSQPELEADPESPSQNDREPEAADSGKTEPEKRKLKLDVQITDVGPCKKHLKVEIAAEEVERQFDESLGKFRKEAAVPGFRPGRAPRLLVQKRYKKEVSGQVKSTLLMSCMEQLDEDYKLNPITQPQLDLEAIEIPDEGPLKFELDIEVQPEFQVPEYKSLKLERPVREVTEPDIDKQQKTFLERYARLVPKTTGGAEMDDYVTADLTFHKGGVRLNQAKEVQFRLLTELRFQDGRIPQLDKALLGAKPGESRESEAKIGTSSPDPAIRGQTIQVEFLIHELKSLRLPELDAAFLDKIGFDSVADLRQAL